MKGNLHFYEQFCTAATPGERFIPGEDIEIQAVAYNNAKLTNIAYSVKVVTNSLFAAASRQESGWQAKIGYLRHLENLDPRVSGANTGSVKFLSAEQIRGLDYEAFRSDAFGGGEVRVTDRKGDRLTDNSLAPVTPPDGFRCYDGKRHSVSGVQVHAGADNAGLFGTLSGTDVRNLRLADFTVSGRNAGALAGAVSGGNIFNVLAVNSGGGSAATATGTGSAGGLIGSVSGECTVEKCAAALVVESDGGSAGGLIGTAAGGVTVTASYAGGHTEGGKYSGGANVTASAAAGGLIGDAGAAAVTACYSTCSVSGGAAGGLVGSGSGVYTDCYATGLVTGTAVGAFAGRYTGTASDCGYFEIVNERPVEGNPEKGYTCLGPVGGGDYGGVIAPMDADPGTYNAWFSNTAKAVPYDGELKTLYPGGYPLRPVATLSGDGGETASCFVSAHYGDWPAPEVIVVNVNVP